MSWHYDGSTPAIMQNYISFNLKADNSIILEDDSAEFTTFGDDAEKTFQLYFCNFVCNCISFRKCRDL